VRVILLRLNRSLVVTWITLLVRRLDHRLRSRNLVRLLRLLLRYRTHRRRRVEGYPAVLRRVDFDPRAHHLARDDAGVVGQESDDDPRRKTDLARHNRRGDGVLLGVTDHALVAEKLGDAIGRVARAARR